MKKSINKGFTLVEILVATAIFMVVMLSAMGGLIVASHASKKAKALQTAMDNVNSAMDEMSRNLRLGSNFSCLPSGGDCVPPNQQPGNSISFLPANSTLTNTFRLWPELAPGGTVHAVQKCDSVGACVYLTSPAINITDLRFIVRGSYLPPPNPAPNDLIQPSVFIMMKGTVSANGSLTNFALQTLASERDAE